MLDQDKNFLLISLIILITCLLDNVRISWGEIVSQSLLGVKGFNDNITRILKSIK